MWNSFHFGKQLSSSFHLNLKSAFFFSSTISWWKQALIIISLRCYLFTRVTEQYHISIFFTLLWSSCTAMLIRYKVKLMTCQRKCHFYSLFVSFLLAVCFRINVSLRILKLDHFYNQWETQMYSILFTIWLVNFISQ